MGKKKSFIDKKTASVYHVVRRSQRDVGTEATAETLSDFVLMPSPENSKRQQARERQRRQQAALESQECRHKKTNFEDLKDRIARAGLLDQTATTYSKYTKPIQGGGIFVPSNIGAAENGELFTDASKNHLDMALQEAMEVHEVGRMLDSIALTPDCMDEDIARALFEDYDDGEFEELLDDFCLTANQEVLEVEGEECGDGASGKNGEFNFEQHIQMLMEKARAKENGGEFRGRKLEENFFHGMTPLHDRTIDEDEDNHNHDYDRYGEEEGEEDSLDREFSGISANYARPISGEQQRILCQKFEEALLEYDSDDVGDLDEECDEIVGSRHLEGDAQLEAALDEFLTEKADEILIEGTKNDERKKRTGGSGYSALIDKRMVNASELDKDCDPSKTLLINIEESKRQMQKDLADADAILANPEMDLPPEEILIDGKSYFSQTSRNPWDCESILSTYSNLDNNPVVIGRSPSSNRKGKKGRKGKDLTSEDSRISEEGPVQINLSNKTGLPLRVFDNYNQSECPEKDHHGYGESDTFISVNRGEARNKQESKTEKKVRKMTIKEERKICRMQKKIMKEAFKDEFQKRGTAEVIDAVGGKAVFRYT
jgi:protein LTV1